MNPQRLPKKIVICEMEIDMRSIRLNLSALRPVRFLLVAFACAMLFFSTPAYSAPANPTGTRVAPQQGEEKLLGIEKETQEATLKNPLTLEETAEKANKGLNEIQGDADRDKMFNPGNSQGATSVEQAAKEALEKVTGKSK